MSVKKEGRVDEFELVIGEQVTPLVGNWSIRVKSSTSGWLEVLPSQLITAIELGGGQPEAMVVLHVKTGNAVDRLESESRDFYDRLGPWATGQAVRSALGVTSSALGQQRKHHRLLGVAFGTKGDFFYPVPQFVDGRVVDGLRDVLTALSSGFASPEAQAAWLAEPAYEGSPETRWDVLRSGDSGLVAKWAAADAHAVAA